MLEPGQGELGERLRKLEVAYASLLRDWGKMSEALADLRRDCDDTFPVVRKLVHDDEVHTLRTQWERELRAETRASNTLTLSAVQTFAAAVVAFCAVAGPVLAVVLR